MESHGLVSMEEFKLTHKEHTRKQKIALIVKPSTYTASTTFEDSSWGKGQRPVGKDISGAEQEMRQCQLGAQELLLDD